MQSLKFLLNLKEVTMKLWIPSSDRHLGIHARKEGTAYPRGVASGRDHEMLMVPLREEPCSLWGPRGLWVSEVIGSLLIGVTSELQGQGQCPDMQAEDSPPHKSPNKTLSCKNWARRKSKNPQKGSEN